MSTPSSQKATATIIDDIVSQEMEMCQGCMELFVSCNTSAVGISNISQNVTTVVNSTNNTNTSRNATTLSSPFRRGGCEDAYGLCIAKCYNETDPDRLRQRCLSRKHLTPIVSPVEWCFGQVSLLQKVMGSCDTTQKSQLVDFRLSLRTAASQNQTLSSNDIMALEARCEQQECACVEGSVWGNQTHKCQGNPHRVCSASSLDCESKFVACLVKGYSALFSFTQEYQTQVLQNTTYWETNFQMFFWEGADVFSDVVISRCSQDLRQAFARNVTRLLQFGGNQSVNIVSNYTWSYFSPLRLSADSYLPSRNGFQLSVSKNLTNAAVPLEYSRNRIDLIPSWCSNFVDGHPFFHESSPCINTTLLFSDDLLGFRACQRNLDNYTQFLSSAVSCIINTLNLSRIITSSPTRANMALRIVCNIGRGWAMTCTQAQHYAAALQTPLQPDEDYGNNDNVDVNNDEESKTALDFPFQALPSNCSRVFASCACRANTTSPPPSCVVPWMHCWLMYLPYTTMTHKVSTLFLSPSNLESWCRKRVQDVVWPSSSVDAICGRAVDVGEAFHSLRPRIVLHSSNVANTSLDALHYDVARIANVDPRWIFIKQVSTYYFCVSVLPSPIPLTFGKITKANVLWDINALTIALIHDQEFRKQYNLSSTPYIVRAPAYDDDFGSSDGSNVEGRDSMGVGSVAGIIFGCLPVFVAIVVCMARMRERRDEDEMEGGG
eukprot:PhF_6_TR26171/c1_g1_i2/m.37165